MCIKLKFYHITKWHIHKPESVLENETYEIIGDFEIETDYIILARRPDLEQINKTKNKKKQKRKENLYRELCHLNRPQSENQRKSRT